MTIIPENDYSGRRKLYKYNSKKQAVPKLVWNGLSKYSN